MPKHIDHNEYPRSLRSKTVDSLLYIIQDAQDALDAYPETDNASFYCDEILYCQMELARRDIRAPRTVGGGTAPRMNGRQRYDDVAQELKALAETWARAAFNHSDDTARVRHFQRVLTAIQEHTA